MSNESLIYDWNSAARKFAPAGIELFDETLRDGLQSPSVTDPPLATKYALLEHMNALHIDVANLGLPGAGPRAFEDTLALVQHATQKKLRIRFAAAARTMQRDIAPIAEIQQKTGAQVEVYAFIGSSPIRFFTEDWTTESVRTHIRESIAFATREGLSTCLVTEDTTRAAPDVLRELFREGLDAGATALCLCDTVGHATPDGVRALLGFAQEVIAEHGQKNVRLDYHGHNDRGLAVINALTALEAGATRIHGSALGVGERVGNAAIDQIIVNLKLLGHYPYDISSLAAYCDAASAALGVAIPINYPALGRDAFRTSTGVHAAAIIKAMKKNDRDLADRVYSSVPATELGRAQEIEIGPMSGLSNVLFWLSLHQVAPDESLAQKILAQAKKSPRALRDEELWAVVRNEG